jgi:hypothetical protein
MTRNLARDEAVRERTVKRFLECEAKRAEARPTALAEGKSEDEARENAHEAARDHWNAWAEEMLAERKALEEREAWAAEKTSWGSLEPKNAETQAWMEKAETNFLRCLLFLKGGEESQEAPGEDKEELQAGSMPVKSIALDGTDINFRGFIFPGNAWFDSATFKGTTWFDSATFEETAFARATFKGSAYFASAIFTKSTSFRGAEFRSKGKTADADFTAIKVERALDLTGAHVSKVPNFCQADFKQAPDLDGVSFPLPSARPWRPGDPDLIPKYRAIRRMAIQGADYEREQMAFKGELRSRRWRIDKWWDPSSWLGVLYDGIADCGRSITQPAIAWGATILAFAAFYWSRAVRGAEARCADGGGAFVQALYLSVKNGLVLFAGTRDARVNQAYVCLYTGSAEQPHIPASVTFVETLLQFPISAVLIFLVLLAVKNRFKIK